jgi:hypothetical protein
MGANFFEVSFCLFAVKGNMKYLKNFLNFHVSKSDISDDEEEEKHSLHRSTLESVEEVEQVHKPPTHVCQAHQQKNSFDPTVWSCPAAKSLSAYLRGTPGSNASKGY